MTAHHCPTCYVPVDVKANAREGRCAACRPERRHSRQRTTTPKEND